MDEEDVGGESVCYAQYFCEECGILLDGRSHLVTCSLRTVETIDLEPHIKN